MSGHRATDTVIDEPSFLPRSGLIVTAIFGTPWAPGLPQVQVEKWIFVLFSLLLFPFLHSDAAEERRCSMWPSLRPMFFLPCVLLSASFSLPVFLLHPNPKPLHSPTVNFPRLSHVSPDSG